MAQRLAIARAVVHRARGCCFWTNPSPDSTKLSAERLSEQLGRLRSEERDAEANGETPSLVVVTHDPRRAAELADRAILLHRGDHSRERPSKQHAEEMAPPMLFDRTARRVRHAKRVMRHERRMALFSGRISSPEWRSRDRLVAMTVFSFLVIVVFQFAWPPMEPAQMVQLAPGVLWVTYVFAAVIGLGRTFSTELENDAMTALALAPGNRGWIFLGKAAATWVLDHRRAGDGGTRLRALLPGRPHDGPLRNSPRSSALANVAICSVGTLLSAMSVRSRFRDVLLPVLLDPDADPGPRRRRDWHDGYGRRRSTAAPNDPPAADRDRGDLFDPLFPALRLSCSTSSLAYPSGDSA